MSLSNEEIAKIVAEQTKFTEEEVLGDLDHWELYEMSDEVMVDEITAQHRWMTDKRLVLRFGERFLEVEFSQGSTEMQDGYEPDMEVREVFPKVVEKTIYTTKRG